MLEKNGNGPSVFANFLKVMVNDKEVTSIFIELN
jgi:hypothetical protein